MSNYKPLFWVLLLNISLYAQDSEEAYYLKKSRHVEIGVAGNVFNIKQTDQFDKMFNQNFEKYRHHSIFYSDFDPVTKLEAETLTTVNGKVKHSKVSVIETKDLVTPGIFYGGYKRKEFVFPTVTSGSIGHAEVIQEIKDPHLITPYYFAQEIFVSQSEFSVSFPKNVTIQYRLFGDFKDQLEFKKLEADNKIEYRWTFKNVQPYRIEKDSPGRSHVAPHIAIFIESYQEGDSKQSVLSDVSELYHWYYSLLQRIPDGGSYSELDAKIFELTKDLTSKEERAMAIFRWVQEHIKYIAFEDGMAGFIPRAANDVYAKRFGDCKDMANLLHYMLNKSNVTTYLAWIGTRDRPYSYRELPTPVADNHMICAVQAGETFYFLDATNPFLEFGKPSSMIQGKEALIGINESDFKVEIVPVENRVSNRRIDSLVLRIDQSGVRGHFSTQLTGYKRDDWQATKLKAQVNNERDYVRDFFKIGDNNISIGLLNDEEDSRNIRFDFFQPAYYSKVGERLFINLNFINALPTNQIPLSRKAAIENEYRYEDKMILKLEIPEGFTVKYLPPETERDWPEFGVRSKYSTEGQMLILERKIYCDYLYLGQKHFENWNEFLRTVTSINNQVVTLSK